MTHTVAAAVELSLDVAIACFHIMAGLVCFGAAACNYLIYSATLRVVALMMFFITSGIAFIGIELAALCWQGTAVHVQRQVSHLNSYHGRALHFLLLALLASDSVQRFSLSSSSPLQVWSWINTIVLASLAFAFVALAVITQFTDSRLLPRSMDVQRAAGRRHGGRMASGHTAVMDDEYDDDAAAERMIGSGARAGQRYSAMMEKPCVSAPSSVLLGGDRPLSVYSLTHGLGLDNVYSPPMLSEKSGYGTASSSAILAPSPRFTHDNFGTPASFSTNPSTPSSHTSRLPTLSLSPRLQQQHQFTSDWVALELSSTGEARFRDNALAMMNRSSTGSLSTEQHVKTHIAPQLPPANMAVVESYEAAEQMQGSDCAKSIRSAASRRSRTGESGRKSFADSRPPSSSSTQRAFAGIVRKAGRRPSNASSFRYETTTDRIGTVEAASPPHLTSPTLPKVPADQRTSAYHRELSYDEGDVGGSAALMQMANSAPSASMTRNRSRRRIFVPSIGRAIELSSGSESSDGEESDDEETRMNTARNTHVALPISLDNDDDDDDDASVYSVQSAHESYSPIDARNPNLTVGSDSVAPLNLSAKQHVSGLGRRLSRKETRSVRGKLGRGIKRAMSQRNLTTTERDVEQDL